MPRQYTYAIRALLLQLVEGDLDLLVGHLATLTQPTVLDVLVGTLNELRVKFAVAVIGDNDLVTGLRVAHLGGALRHGADTARELLEGWLAWEVVHLIAAGEALTPRLRHGLRKLGEMVGSVLRASHLRVREVAVSTLR